MHPDRRAQSAQDRHRPTPRTPEEVAADAFERAQPLLEAGQLEEAITLLQTAVHHSPEKAAHHAALGRALGRVPSLAREAVQALEKATQLDPRSAAAFAELAVILARQGLRLRAQKAAEAALRLAPRDTRIARLAAELGLGQG
jgi:tetratricopeptide (TPR) repeat protein